MVRRVASEDERVSALISLAPGEHANQDIARFTVVELSNRGVDASPTMLAGRYPGNGHPFSFDMAARFPPSRTSRNQCIDMGQAAHVEYDA
jgi:hypothetical protein